MGGLCSYRRIRTHIRPALNFVKNNIHVGFDLKKEIGPLQFLCLGCWSDIFMCCAAIFSFRKNFHSRSFQLPEPALWMRNTAAWEILAEYNCCEQWQKTLSPSHRQRWVWKALLAREGAIGQLLTWKALHNSGRCNLHP